MRHLYWLYYLLCSFSSCGAFSNENIVVYTEQFPPYNFYQDGEIKGLNIDLVKAACRLSKIDCSFELYPWKRAFTMSQTTPNGGLLSTARIPSREDLFHWIGPLVSSPTCFYKLRSRDDIVVETKEDLLNYTVGLPWADIYEQVLTQWGYEEGKNYITFSEKYAYSRAFKSNKLDLFLASSNTLNEHLTKLNLNIEDVEPIYLLVDPIFGGNYLALNLQVKPQLVNKLQQQVTMLMNSDELDTFKEKYITHLGYKTKNTSTRVKQCEL
ncbi:substrate-binding periplasmic protein [Thalassotalea eurytherma]|uniref:Amino acid ABC transporter substrate-binding protein n=1 Tax=Thalassotalea eurytherma TaxID=1144278 RepID=A0ABQ6H2H7_9GAMM|nr:transporter substrate-binding domain-containing protein [Thalassotalea eurytherma]GLX82383.1 amino acid ABC transporter substrate-binding protein [Thalassotalea eurytherma]